MFEQTFSHKKYKQNALHLLKEHKTYKDFLDHNIVK